MSILDKNPMDSVNMLGTTEAASNVHNSQVSLNPSKPITQNMKPSFASIINSGESNLNNSAVNQEN